MHSSANSKIKSVFGQSRAGTVQMATDHVNTATENLRLDFESYLGEQLRGNSHVRMWAKLIWERVRKPALTTSLSERIDWDTHRSGISGRLQSLEELTAESSDLDTNVNKINKLIALNKTAYEQYTYGGGTRVLEGNILAESKHPEESGVSRQKFDYKPWERDYHEWPESLLVSVGAMLQPKIAEMLHTGTKPSRGAWSRVSSPLTSTEASAVRDYLVTTWPAKTDIRNVLTSIGYAWSEERDTDIAEAETFSIGPLNPHGAGLRQHHAGERINILEETNPWIQEARLNQMPLLSGPSGTSLRYLQFWDKNGDGSVSMEEARLVVLANLLPPSSHHSYHEIMTASIGIGGLKYENPGNYSDLWDNSMVLTRTIIDNFIKLYTTGSQPRVRDLLFSVHRLPE